MTAATAQITTRASTTGVILHRLLLRRRLGASVGSDPAATSERAPPGSPLFTAGSVLREPCKLPAARSRSRGIQTSASRDAFRVLSLRNRAERAHQGGIVRLLCHRARAL